MSASLARRGDEAMTEYVKDPYCQDCDDYGIIWTQCCYPLPVSRIECECGNTGGYIGELCGCVEEVEDER